VFAPEPVSVTDPPRHIAVLVVEAVTVGLAFTVTEWNAVLEHVPLAPVTVYVMLTVGETLIVFDTVVEVPESQV
jgi:hypothetical protein